MARKCLSSLALPWVVLLLAGACGSEAEPGESPPGGGGSGAAGATSVDVANLPYAPCADETRVGEFVITLAPEFTSVEGKVVDSVTPSLVPEQLESEGECRLVRLPNLLCDPGCPASTQTCGPGNQCLPLPVALDVGTVSVAGLVREVEMTANAATGNYRPPPPALPHPGFEPGAALRLSSSGGAAAPFELWGWGIDVFEPGPDPIEVAEGQPVRFGWVAPAEPGPARINARLNINNHGSSNTWLECDVPDTGSAELPASLVDALIAQGASGFPTLTISRRTATSTELEPGCVQLLVRSEQALDVSVAGIVSCESSEDCPDGQTCSTLEQFCQ